MTRGDGKGASKGTQIESSWAQTMRGIDYGSYGWGDRVGVSNGGKGRATATEHQ